MNLSCVLLIFCVMCKLSVVLNMHNTGVTQPTFNLTYCRVSQIPSYTVFNGSGGLWTQNVSLARAEKGLFVEVIFPLGAVCLIPLSPKRWIHEITIQ